LVTGGAGFIGSNLCEELCETSGEVVCLDDFSTGKFENIRHLIDRKNFRLLVGDIRNLDDCRRVMEGVDYVLSASGGQRGVNIKINKGIMKFDFKK